MIHVQSLQHALGNSVTNNLLFLHAITGCDATCAMFNKSKTTAMNVIQKNSELINQLRVFYDANADPESLNVAGESFVMKCNCPFCHPQRKH